MPAADTVDEIVGVVLTRELLRYAEKLEQTPERIQLRSTNVSSLMEPVAFIPESMSAMNALKQMRRQRLHMMVVVDEFGGTSGIVTLEDILETLVGEIYDEDDEEELIEDTSSIVQVLRAMPMPTALPTAMPRAMPMAMRGALCNLGKINELRIRSFAFIHFEA